MLLTAVVVVLGTGSEVINFFSCSVQQRMKFVKLIKIKYQKIETFFLQSRAEHEFFLLLINIKMRTIVLISIFISRKNFMLNGVEHDKSFITRVEHEESFITWVEHERSFITSCPECILQCFFEI